MLHQYLANLLADHCHTQPNNVLIVEDRTRCCRSPRSLSATFCHNEATHPKKTKLHQKQEPNQEQQQQKGCARERRWLGGVKRYTSDSCLSMPKRRTSTENNRKLSDMIRWTSISSTVFPDEGTHEFSSNINKNSRKELLLSAVDVALDLSDQRQVEEQEVRRPARHVAAPSSDSPLAVPTRFLSPPPAQKGKVC